MVIISGLNEQRSLYIMQYEEFIEGASDYIIAFRGIMANNEQEAYEKAQLIIDYFNQEYNQSDDWNNPDYIFRRVYVVSDLIGKMFLISDESIEHMRRTLSWER